MPRLWLAIRLPDLPINALVINGNMSVIGCQSNNDILIITEKRQVMWASSAAISAGVTLGMDTTTAQLLSACVSQARCLEAEAKLLDNICADMYTFTPYIEIYTSTHIPQAGVLLEISTCLTLFGGLKTLIQKIAQYFSANSLAFAFGLAHSTKAAWMLSFVYYTIRGDETQALFLERLRHLPIQLLHDYPKQVDALEKTGFVLLDDIAKQIDKQSISSMKKRFGPVFAQALCDIFGIDHDFQQGSLFERPITAYQVQDFFSEDVQFEYPIHQIDQLQTPVEHLLKKLTAFLRKRQLQTHEIEWVLEDIYHNQELLNVYADHAQSDWPLLFDLTFIQLENRQLPFEVNTLKLSCRDTQMLEAKTQLLDFENRLAKPGQDFTRTSAKLKARLGEASVYKLSYRDSYIAEESNQRVLLSQVCQQQLPDCHMYALRPNWLLKKPATIELRKQGLYWRGYLTLLTGPERLQGYWWKIPSARDYFLAQRTDFVRLWVFLDLHAKAWYVQGIFA